MTVLRRELGLEAKIWLLTVVVAAAAVGAYLGLVAPLGTGPSELDVPWWLVAAGFAAAERWVVHLHFRRSTHSLSLGELPLVAGLLFLPAHELVIAGLVGSSIALAFDREIPTFKAFFNLAQFTLGTCAALFVVEGLVTVRDPLDPIVWVAVFAAVSAATLIADRDARHAPRREPERVDLGHVRLWRGGTGIGLSWSTLNTSLPVTPRSTARWNAFRTSVSASSSRRRSYSATSRIRSAPSR